VAATDAKPHRPPRCFARRRLPQLIRRALGAHLIAGGRAKRSVPAQSAPNSAPLRALMVAALALKGMAPASAQTVEVESAAVQFGGYREGGTQFWAGPNGTLQQPSPLRVDTFRAGATFRMNDRLRLGLEFLQDTWSGATPYITAPEGFIQVTGASAYVATDKAAAAGRVDRVTLVPFNLQGRPLVPQPQIINLWTSASAETRNQFRASLNYEWNDAALGVSGGISDEPDFRSGTIGLNGRWDFNQKLTSLSGSVGYTKARVDANLGVPSPYVDYGLYVNPPSGPRIVSVSGPGLVLGVPSSQTQTLRFQGDREDVAVNAGITQILTRNTTVSTGLTYSRSSGFLENPYKLVLLGFANPATPPVLGYFATNLFAVQEKRPDVRNQWTWNIHLAQYVPPANAALHLDYAYSSDDWGIRAQTLAAKWAQPLGDGWTITPTARYYTQSAANFFQPYFLFRQAYPRNPSNAGLLDFSRMPIPYWSSDQRLAGFGALSFGLIITKQFAKDVRLEIGYENYRRSGDLKLGGGGVGSYADLSANVLNVGLVFEFQNGPSGDSGGHDHHHPDDGDEPQSRPARHLGADAPAGVMNAHMMDVAGGFMAAYNAMYSRQSGSTLGGSVPATDAAILASCGVQGCPTTPSKMTMQMHMLELMYAPTSWLNLMLMPQMVAMSMSNRILDGGFYTPVGGHSHAEMDLSGHHSGGFGDTTAGALLQLYRSARSEVHLGLGLSIPTGSINERMPSHGNELLDYGMQLGSGTWDFIPTLTYNGSARRWTWGAQVGMVKRLGGPNNDGYTLGDLYQGTAWVNYHLADTFAVSLRGLAWDQGAISGQLKGTTAVVDASGTVSYPRPLDSSAGVAGNYGGRFVDLGFGFSFAVPGRERQGDRIAFEWLQPVKQNVNGYQLERTGSAALSWRMMF